MSKAKRRTTATAQPSNKKDSTPSGINNMANWIVILVAILPLLFSNVTMDPNITVRYLFLSIFIVCFLVYFFVVQKNTIDFSFPLLVKAVFIAGACFVVWNVIALSASINKAAGYYEIARHLLYLVLLFICMNATRNGEVKIIKICNTIVVMALIQSFIGIFQYYELAFTEIPGANAFPFGLMSNRNLFGSAQAFTLPFVIYSLYRGSRKWSIAAIVSIIMILFSVVISQTRSSWISVAAIIIISFILVAIFSRQDLKKWAIGTGLAIGATILVVIFLFATAKDNSFSTSVKQRALSLAGSANDSSEVTNNATERVRIWNKTLDMIKDKPVLGVGPGNWKVVIPSYGTEGLVWANGNFVPDRPHNEYLRVAAETGVPAAILYFGMWVLTGIIAFKIIIGNASRERKIPAILMLSGLAAFATDCMFSFPTERIEHSLYTILMAGIILGLYSNQYPKQGVPSQAKKWYTWLLIFIAVINIFMAYKKYNFEVSMNLAKGFESEARYTEEIDAAEAGKSAFVTIDPNGYPIELRTGNAYHELKNWTLALSEMQQGLKYNPNSANIYINMGTVYTDMKLYTKAIECYEKAVKITPGSEIALKNLAVNYYETANYAGCIKVLEKLEISNDTFLTGLLNQAKEKVKVKN
ncbi:MAG TPA: O-antigen ligase family protein [Ferruginibacter sp.]|nr:O-antigen ligase family protein [Ferruginibacter sp.]